MRRLITATAGSVLLLAGCAVQSDTTSSSAEPTQSAADSAESPGPVAAPLLADYELQGMDTVEVIDHLDRLDTQDRPTELMASVRPDELQLTAGKEKLSLPIPEDRFYLSVAPYLDQTHDCFYHSLTTCQGELGQEDIDLKIVDTATGEVLVEGTYSTFANGFVGFWLPRSIDGTLEVAYDGKVGRTEISTGQDAPTCLTTLRLA
jgi:CheY-like chemotaxis protein